MARLTNLILVAFFFVTISAFEEEPLTKCGKHIGAHCGQQVIDKMMSPNDHVIFMNCCYKLVQTGLPCHTKLSLYVLQTCPELKNTSRSDFMTKSDEIYNQCDLLTRSGSPEFLANCIEHLGSSCGEQIYNKLMHDKSITKQCCGKLVKTGLPCHVSMAKALIRSPNMRDINAIELLKKNKKIFDECDVK